MISLLNSITKISLGKFIFCKILEKNYLKIILDFLRIKWYLLQNYYKIVKKLKIIKIKNKQT